MPTCVDADLPHHLMGIWPHPDEAAIADITAQIDALRPDVVITFGPDGITGHRDHRIASAWVTEAWRRVGHGDLLYATRERP